MPPFLLISSLVFSSFTDLYFYHGIEKILKVTTLSSNTKAILFPLPISSSKPHHSKDHSKKAHTNSNHTKQEW